jgi:hypothetical protein
MFRQFLLNLLYLYIFNFWQKEKAFSGVDGILCERFPSIDAPETEKEKFGMFLVADRNILFMGQSDCHKNHQNVEWADIMGQESL